MKVVLDTNCLLRAVASKSVYHCILTALHQRRYTLCYSNDILMEYEETLLRFFARKTVDHAMNFIFYSVNTLFVAPYYKWNLITTDPDDNKFVDCAINAGADCIVTNDKHFNILKTIDFPKINIIDIDTLKKLISVL